ncbi:hypothetical protein Poli38472_013468 [Pythium oligandrum]|uniref:RCC1-like domain-containing protein n=1 Tax=Pythium oligandrum TaxID=41045 RepID=A0A8K1C7R0_PYTOL|nr:hypothetical protein Poli38472_013468 [Pythium oligandrum]|eukprot:TMW57994.1 hypothetical protein Poli38472_013468 [Pythium oligandrum]
MMRAEDGANASDCDGSTRENDAETSDEEGEENEDRVRALSRSPGTKRSPETASALEIIRRRTSSVFNRSNGLLVSATYLTAIYGGAPAYYSLSLGEKCLSAVVVHLQLSLDSVRSVRLSSDRLCFTPETYKEPQIVRVDLMDGCSQTLMISHRVFSLDKNYDRINTPTVIVKTSWSAVGSFISLGGALVNQRRNGKGEVMAPRTASTRIVDLIKAMSPPATNASEFNVPLTSIPIVVSHMASGNHFSFIVAKQHTEVLLANGMNTNGELGIGSTTPMVDPVPVPTMSIQAQGEHVSIVSVSCGKHHVAMATTQGRLFTWGNNKFGQLGHGDYTNYLSPHEVNFSLGLWRSASNQRALRIKHTIVDHGVLAGGGNVTQVACGAFHTLFVTHQQHLLAMGFNQAGQLGLGHRLQSHKGWRSCTPTVLETLRDRSILDIAAGQNHSACVTSHGDIFVWGCGDDGRLGVGKNGDCEITPALVLSLKDLGVRARRIRCGARHTAIISDRDLLYMWGANEFGQLGTGDKKTRTRPCLINFPAFVVDGVVDVALGEFHSACVTFAGRAYIWGLDLTCETTTRLDQRCTPELIALPDEEQAQQIACGWSHTSVVTQTYQDADAVKKPTHILRRRDKHQRQARRQEAAKWMRVSSALMAMGKFQHRFGMWRTKKQSVHIVDIVGTMVKGKTPVLKKEEDQKAVQQRAITRASQEVVSQIVLEAMERVLSRSVKRKVSRKKTKKREKKDEKRSPRGVSRAIPSDRKANQAMAVTPARLRAAEESLLATDALYHVDMERLYAENAKFLEIASTAQQHVETLQAELPAVQETFEHTRSALQDLSHDITTLHENQASSKQEMLDHLEHVFQAQTDERVALVEAHIVEKEEMERAHADQVEELTTRFQEQVEDLEAKYTAMETTCLDEIETLKQKSIAELQRQREQANAELEQLRTVAAKENDELERSLNDQIQALTEKSENELSELRTSSQASYEALESTSNAAYNSLKESSEREMSRALQESASKLMEVTTRLETELKETQERTAAEIHLLKTEYAASKATLEKDTAAEVERLKREHAEKVAQLQAERNTDVNALKKQLETTQRDLHAEMEVLTARHLTEVTALKATMDAERSSLTEEYSRSMREMQSKSASKLQKTTETYETRIASLIASHTAEVTRLTSEARTKQEDLTNGFERQLQSLRDDSRQERDALVLRYESQMDLLQRTTTEEIDKITKQTEDQIKQMRDAHATQVLGLETMIREQEKQHQAVEENLRKELEESQLRVKTLEDVETSLRMKQAIILEQGREARASYGMSLEESDAKTRQWMQHCADHVSTIEELRQELKLTQDDRQVKVTTILELTFVIKSRDDEIEKLHASLLDSIQNVNTKTEILELTTESLTTKAKELEATRAALRLETGRLSMVEEEMHQKEDLLEDTGLKMENLRLKLENMRMEMKRLQMEMKLQQEHSDSEMELKNGEISRLYAAQSELKQRNDATQQNVMRLEDALGVAQRRSEELRRRMELLKLEVTQHADEALRRAQDALEKERDLTLMTQEKQLTVADKQRALIQVNNLQHIIQCQRESLERQRMACEDVQCQYERVLAMTTAEKDERLRREKHLLLFELNATKEVVREYEGVKHELQRSLETTVALRGDLAAVEDEKTKLIARVEKLTQEIATRDAALEASREELDTQTHEWKARITEARVRLEAATHENERLAALLSNETQQWHSQMQRTTKASEELQEELQDAQGKLEKLQEAYERKTEAHLEATDALEEYRAAEETWKREHEALQQQINENMSAIESLDGTVGAKSSEIEALQALVEEKLHQIKEATEAQANQHDSHSQQLKAMEESLLAQMNEHVEAIRLLHESHGQEREAQVRVAAELEAQLSDLKKRHDTLEYAHDQANAQTTYLLHQLKHAEGVGDKLRERAELVSMANEEATEQIAFLIRQLKQVEDDRDKSTQRATTFAMASEESVMQMEYLVTKLKQVEDDRDRSSQRAATFAMASEESVMQTEYLVSKLKQVEDARDALRGRAETLTTAMDDAAGQIHYLVVQLKRSEDEQVAIHQRLEGLRRTEREQMREVMETCCLAYEEALTSADGARVVAEEQFVERLKALEALHEQAMEATESAQTHSTQHWQKQIETLKDEAEASQQRLRDEHVQQMTQSEAEWNSRREQMDEMRRNLEEELGKLTADLGGTKTQLQQREKRIEELLSTLQTKEQSLSENQELVRTHKATIESVRKELNLTKELMSQEAEARAAEANAPREDIAFSQQTLLLMRQQLETMMLEEHHVALDEHVSDFALADEKDVLQHCSGLLQLRCCLSTLGHPRVVTVDEGRSKLCDFEKILQAFKPLTVLPTPSVDAVGVIHCLETYENVLMRLRTTLGVESAEPAVLLAAVDAYQPVYRRTLKEDESIQHDDTRCATIIAKLDDHDATLALLGNGGEPSSESVKKILLEEEDLVKLAQDAAKSDTVMTLRDIQAILREVMEIRAVFDSISPPNRLLDPTDDEEEEKASSPSTRRLRSRELITWMQDRQELLTESLSALEWRGELMATLEVVEAIQELMKIVRLFESLKPATALTQQQSQARVDQEAMDDDILMDEGQGFRAIQNRVQTILTFIDEVRLISHFAQTILDQECDASTDDGGQSNPPSHSSSASSLVTLRALTRSPTPIQALEIATGADIDAVLDNELMLSDEALALPHEDPPPSCCLSDSLMDISLVMNDHHRILTETTRWVRKIKALNKTGSYRRRRPGALDVSAEIGRMVHGHCALLSLAKRLFQLKEPRDDLAALLECLAILGRLTSRLQLFSVVSSSSSLLSSEACPSSASPLLQQNPSQESIQSSSASSTSAELANTTAPVSIFVSMEEMARHLQEYETFVTHILKTHHEWLDKRETTSMEALATAISTRMALLAEVQNTLQLGEPASELPALLEALQHFVSRSVMRQPDNSTGMGLDLLLKCLEGAWEDVRAYDVLRKALREPLAATEAVSIVDEDIVLRVNEAVSQLASYADKTEALRTEIRDLVGQVCALEQARAEEDAIIAREDSETRMEALQRLITELKTLRDKHDTVSATVATEDAFLEENMHVWTDLQQQTRPLSLQEALAALVNRVEALQADKQRLESSISAVDVVLKANTHRWIHQEQDERSYSRSEALTSLVSCVEGLKADKQTLEAAIASDNELLQTNASLWRAEDDEDVASCEHREIFNRLFCRIQTLEDDVLALEDANARDETLLKENGRLWITEGTTPPGSRADALGSLFDRIKELDSATEDLKTELEASVVHLNAAETAHSLQWNDEQQRQNARIAEEKQFLTDHSIVVDELDGANSPIPVFEMFVNERAAVKAQEEQRQNDLSAEATYLTTQSLVFDPKDAHVSRMAVYETLLRGQNMLIDEKMEREVELQEARALLERHGVTVTSHSEITGRLVEAIEQLRAIEQEIETEKTLLSAHGVDASSIQAPTFSRLKVLEALLHHRSQRHQADNEANDELQREVAFLKSQGLAVELDQIGITAGRILVYGDLFKRLGEAKTQLHAWRESPHTDATGCQQAEETHLTTIEQLKDEAKTQLEALMAEHQAVLEQTESAHRQAVESAAVAYEQALTNEKKAHEAAVEAIELAQVSVIKDAVDAALRTQGEQFEFRFLARTEAHEHETSSITSSDSVLTRAALLEAVTKRDNTAVSRIYRLIRLATDILNTSAFAGSSSALTPGNGEIPVDVTQAVLTCVKELKALKDFLIDSLEQLNHEFVASDQPPFLKSQDTAGLVTDHEAAVEFALCSHREFMAYAQQLLLKKAEAVNATVVRLTTSLAQHRDAFDPDEVKRIETELSLLQHKTTQDMEATEKEVDGAFWQCFQEERKIVEEELRKALETCQQERAVLIKKVEALEHEKQALVLSSGGSNVPTPATFLSPRTPLVSSSLVTYPTRPDKPRDSARLKTSGTAYKERFVSDLERETGQRRSTSTAARRANEWKRHELLSSSAQIERDFRMMETSTPQSQYVSISPPKSPVERSLQDQALWYQGVRTIHYISFFISVFFVPKQRMFRVEVFNSDTEQQQTIYVTYDELEVFVSESKRAAKAGVTSLEPVVGDPTKHSDVIDVLFDHVKVYGQGTPNVLLAFE